MEIDSDIATLFLNDTFRPATVQLAGNSYAKRIQMLIKRWVEFKAGLGLETDSTRPFEPPPTPQQMMAYFQWQSRYGKGTIAKKLSLRTVQKNFTEFRLEVRRQTGHEYSRFEISTIGNFINTTIKAQEGLSTKARAKTIADRPVVVDIIRYLWTQDEYDFRHPRMRIQLACAILLMHYVGLRPGEYVESSSHRGSNEGMHWKDVTFLMIADSEGMPLFAAQLHIRNRKGRRDQEWATETENLREDRTQRAMCPVSLLLALAIADDALEDITCVQDLARVRFSPARTLTELRIRKEKRDVPIFRTAGNNRHEIHPTAILNGTRIAELMNDLGHRAGYQANLGTYSLRRGHGNQLDRFVTAAQRRRQMGHKQEDTFMSYISNISGVDVQNIMSEREPDQQTIDFLRSMRTHIDFDAPRPLGSSLEDPRYWFAAKSTRSALEAREIYAASARDIFQGTATSTALSDEVIRPPASPAFQQFLKFDQARAMIIMLLSKEEQPSLEGLLLPMVDIARPYKTRWWYPHASPDQTSHACPCGMVETKTAQSPFAFHVLRCKISLLTEDLNERWRKEFLGNCPKCQWAGCGDSFRDASPTKIANHISSHFSRSRRCFWGGCFKWHETSKSIPKHQTEHHKLPTEGSVPEVRYCFNCSEFTCTLNGWEAHAAAHLRNLDQSCGRIMRRGLSMKAFTCPFCLGNAALSAGARYKQWIDRNTFLKHVQRHLDTRQARLESCPHPRCIDGDSISDIFEHLRAVHRVHLVSEHSSTNEATEESEEDIYAPVDLSVAPMTAVPSLVDAEVPTPGGDAAIITRGLIDPDMPVFWDTSERQGGSKLADSEAHQGSSHSPLSPSTKVDDPLDPDSTSLDEAGPCCHICNRTFERQTALKNHLKSHKQRVCNVSGCEVVCPTWKKTIAHMIKAHGTSPWTCDLPSLKDPGTVCGIALQDSAALRNHKKTHANAASLTCKQCSRRFRKKQTLDQHVIWEHKGEYPHVCTLYKGNKQCLSPFALEWQLRDHVKKYHAAKKE